MPEADEDVRRRLRRKRVAYVLRARAEQFASAIKTALVVVGLLLVVALEIPWLAPALRGAGFESLSSVGMAVIVFILVLLYFDVRSISAKQHLTPETHFEDPLSLYPVLWESIRKVKRREDKVLDVLGMTLYTAWPTLTFWLQHPEMDGWTIRLCAMVDDSGRQADFVPGDWSEESRANLNSAIQTRDNLAKIGRAVTIQTYAYDFMPVVHGFRLANGELFVSFLSWEDDGRIGREAYSYQYLPCGDESLSAAAMRNVYASWFERASKSAWPRNVAGGPGAAPAAIPVPADGAASDAAGE